MTVFPAIIPLDINRNETAFTEEEVWCNTLNLILSSLVCHWRTLPLTTINTSIQQRRIQNQVNIYDEAFLLLAVNYFCKKAPWQMFDWVLNTPLQDINQRQSNTLSVTITTLFTEEHLEDIGGAISVFSVSVVELL